MNVILLCLLVAGDVPDAPPESDIWIDEDSGAIKVPFETNGYTFFQGEDGEGGGLPLEAFLKLVAVKGNRRTILHRTTSLRSYVKLKNGNEALAFVRLFTDENSHYLFKDSLGIEIRHVPSALSAFVKNATMSTSRFKELGLFDPRVRKTANGSFVIERFILTPKREIVQTEETVESDGRYTATIIKRLGKDARMNFPRYE